MVNRIILCNCHLELDLTYLLKSVGSCTNQHPVTPMEFTINIAFYHYLKEIWNETAISVIPTGFIDYEYKFPVYLRSCKEIYGSEYPDSTITSHLEELNNLQSFCIE